MKKLFAFLMSLVLVFAFSGCGNKKTNITQTDDSNDTPYVAQNDSKNETSNTVVSKNQSVQSAVSSQKAESSKVEIPSQASPEPQIDPERPEKVTKVYEYEDLGVVPSPVKKIFKDSQNGNTLPYCLYLPENYSYDKKYPVILYLHGAGELGSDNKAQLVNFNKAFTNNADIISQAIIICPQTDVWWALDREYDGDRKGTLSSALNLLKEIQATYPCDGNRLYVTGISMGGYATWDLLERHGSIFAAGAPICGGGNDGNGAAFKDIPIRIYHGTADPTVSFNASQRMYNAIKAVGGTKVELFALEGVEHNAWDYAYADRDFFAWLFAQNKSKKDVVKYDVPYRFAVLDINGNVVIDEKDIIGIGSFEISGSVDVELTLSSAGREKLKNAYTKSGGKEFTVYCMSQKFYSFTATKAPADNLFVISDVFTEDNFTGFYKTIQRVCLNIT